MCALKLLLCSLTEHLINIVKEFNNEFVFIYETRTQTIQLESQQQVELKS